MITHSLDLTLQQEITPAEATPTEAQFAQWLQAALPCDAEITIRIVDATEGQTLNKDYRGKDYPTNVLTFGYDDEDMPSIPDMPLLGDIVLCHPVVTQEALEQHKTLEAHYAHLTIHSALHLRGYDHQEDAEAEEMEALETAILEKLGYPDPYAAEKV